MKIKKQTMWLLLGGVALLAFSSKSTGVAAPTLDAEDRRQNTAIELFESMTDVIEDDAHEATEFKKAAAAAIALYQKSGGSDVAFIARLNAMGIL